MPERESAKLVVMVFKQRAPILKSMMKISNKLKTAAKVFDVFLKENKSSLELESSTFGI